MTMSTRMLNVIINIFILLAFLYVIGYARQEAREATRNKIIEAVKACYSDSYNILGPTAKEIIDCIKNAKIK